MKAGKGFFAMSSLMSAKKPLPMIANCQTCRLCNGCESPFMKPSGNGRKKILVVGEAPGQEEDARGEPFIGKWGKKIRGVLNKFGIDTVRDVYWTDALICRPAESRIKDLRAIEYCRPNLLKTIEELKPKVIILLGAIPVKSLIGFLWKEDVGGIARWEGWRIPSQRYNAWICPTYHPSYLARKEHPVMEKMFTDQLEWACEQTERPWREIPDYKSQVRVIFDDTEAATEILTFCKSKRPVAFDYETNMLKPEHARARIVCCSLSDGTKTIAFPWIGRVIAAMKRFFASPVPKIASNMKFEDRWTNCKVGVEVKNWKLDTMLAAHVLDNRPEITSIKFQAFTLLGQEAYDEHIKPFLKSKQGGGYGENRIDEVDKTDLMTYCALDSLLEWKVALKQYHQMEQS